MAEPRKIQVTLLKSTIGCSEKLRKVVLALGLYKTNQVVKHTETETILGMLHKVSHLIKVEAV
jgi:large subunit ribosomal protein L30